MANSTARPPKKLAPPKKRNGSPIRPHAAGTWVKKIGSKNVYFGRWKRTKNGVEERVPGDGFQEALTLYLAQKDDLLAGRTPRATPGEGELSVGAMCNLFLTHKQRLLKSGEIASRTFGEYKATTDRLVNFFGASSAVDGLRPEDFDELRANISQNPGKTKAGNDKKPWGPVRTANEVGRVRSVFIHARKSEVVSKEFKKPSKKVLRQHRAKRPKKLFSAEEIQSLLKIAPVPLKAMILLGINCGFGNKDCAELLLSEIDLKSGWHSFPRGKTGTARRCPLWPETIQAIEAALQSRPKPSSKKDNGLVFITVRGNAWARDEMEEKSVDGEEVLEEKRGDRVGQQFGKLLRKLKLDGVSGRSFYALRHTFQTVARRSKDREATLLIMGHIDGSIDSHYIEEIDDEDLVAVTDYVHRWLFPPKAKKPRKPR